MAKEQSRRTKKKYELSSGSNSMNVHNWNSCNSALGVAIANSLHRFTQKKGKRRTHATAPCRPLGDPLWGPAQNWPDLNLKRHDFALNRALLCHLSLARFFPKWQHARFKAKPLCFRLVSGISMFRRLVSVGLLWV